jgi:hypothetical protein
MPVLEHTSERAIRVGSALVRAFGFFVVQPSVNDDTAFAVVANEQPILLEELCSEPVPVLITDVKVLIEEQQRAEEEQASQQSLKAIQRAFHEAMLALPREEYDWFDVQSRARQEACAAKLSAGGVPEGTDLEDLLPGLPRSGRTDTRQLQFFDYAGPLFSVVVSPAASTVPLNEIRKFRALPRDRSRRHVIDDLQFAWRMVEGAGALQEATNQEVEYRAPAAPGLARLSVTVPA